jgi:hypothetical protein
MRFIFLNRTIDVGVAQVDETVATEHKVGVRQWVYGKVEPQEVPPWRREFLAIARHNAWDNIGAYVANAMQIYMAHPAKIATWHIKH